MRQPLPLLVLVLLALGLLACGMTMDTSDGGGPPAPDMRMCLSGGDLSAFPDPWTPSDRPPMGTVDTYTVFHDWLFGRSRALPCQEWAHVLAGTCMESWGSYLQIEGIGIRTTYWYYQGLLSGIEVVDLSCMPTLVWYGRELTCTTATRQEFCVSYP